MGQESCQNLQDYVSIRETEIDSTCDGNYVSKFNRVFEHRRIRKSHLRPPYIRY